MNYMFQEERVIPFPRRQEIHSEYVQVPTRNENYKIEFFPMMNDYNNGKYKIKISIVVSDLKTNVRKKFLESFINALDLATLFDCIRRKDFTSKKFFGGGVEEGQTICRITEFTLKQDGSLTITIQKCPGQRNADGGYKPIGKPLDQISIYLRGFPLQRLMYRVITYIEHKMIMDFKKFEFEPAARDNQNSF
jgi:hypothetical protein